MDSIPLTMLYLLARRAACTPFPEPVGPRSTILGVWGALDLGWPHRKEYTMEKDEKGEIKNLLG